MRLLVDTHVFLWAATAPEKLSDRTRDLLCASETGWVFSVISAWEIQIKASVGKLDIAGSLEDSIAQARARTNMELLPLLIDHVLALDGLPAGHKDPFDRALAAQARAEALPIVSRNPAFDQLGVERIW